MHTNIPLVIIFTCCLNFCVCIKYYNYTLFRGIPVERIHMQFLKNLTMDPEVNFWRHPGLMFKPADFVISPAAKPNFLRQANNIGMYLTTIIEDVQKAFDMQTVKSYIRRKMDSFDWNNFFRVDDIYQWLRDLAKLNPHVMAIQSIGKTHEGRRIMAVRIVLEGCKMRSKVIVEGGIHAREWISPAFVTYFINEIVKSPYSNNEALKEVALTYEWFFVPVLNPDGYEYSHTQDRLWRKNRHDGSYGIDLNRNFDHAFGYVGISRKKSSDIYCGAYAFSENESLAMANFIRSKRDNLEYYLAFHSYGQYMIIPYADRKTHEENFDEVKQMCMEAKSSIASKYKTQYTVGTAYDTVGYMTSGVSGCWVKKELRVPGIPVKRIHMQFLKNLTMDPEVNFWRHPGLMFKPVDFVVSPEAKPNFLRQADDLGMYLTTIIEDVQKAFDMQTVKSYIRRKMDSFDWNNYFRVDDIYQWLGDLARLNPRVMEIQSIGRSHENRNIMAVRIVLKGCKMRSTVIVEGGIHAREWIAPAFVTYLINEIVKSPYSKNEALKEVALTYEWFFVPVLNPDGYEYSHTQDRLWRKNRHDNHGVDLNRNFGHTFGSVGISWQKTSDIYCGAHAFSENESLAMANFIRSKRDNLEYYLAFHSYGQYMIIPYADRKTHEENFDEVKKMCTQAKLSIASKYKTQYSIGTAYDTVGYMVSGVSGCWVKKEFRVPYVVTFELRDNGYDGFALPPQKIMPTCQETMDGVITLLKPRTTPYKKLRENPHSYGRVYILDKIVIVFYVFLFIIVRFD